MKRIVLFLATNLAILLVLSITARLLGVDRFLTANGLNLGMLLGFAAVIGFGGAFISLAISKWVAKRSTGARVIEQPRNADEQWLLETVRRQAQQAGIGMPEVAIYDSPAMNAFATGMNRNNAMVAVSTGLMRSMSADEVEAVLAHEVSHVANGDMVTLTLIQGVVNTFVIFLARVVGYAVDSFLRRDGDHSGPGIGYFVATIAAEIVLGILARQQPVAAREKTFVNLRHSVHTLTERYQPRLQAAGRNLRAALAQAQAEAVPALQALGQLLRTRRLPERVPIALKLAFAFVLLIATGMVALGLMVGSNQSELLEQQMDKYGATLVQQMAETAREPLLANDHLNLELLTNNLTQDPNIKGAALYSDERQPVISTGLVPDLLGISSQPSRFNAQISLYSWEAAQGDNGQELISYLTPIPFRDITVGYALITFDYSVMAQAKQETVTTVVSAILLMLLLAIAISFYLGRRFTRPIQQLVEASKAFADGRYDYRITEERNDELGVLMQSINFMGEGLLRKEQVEQVFSRYVSPQVARRAIADLEHMEQLELGGRHVEASVLFADIVGFTSMSENMTPQETSSLLNLYFSNIARAVHFCQGHIDKYMGDCAMIVFGVPEEYKEHSFYSLACAWMILELVRQMNEQRQRKGLAPVEFRIGVNSGTMLAGNMGSTERMEYTVVGDAVNLASRLSHAGEPGQIIVTEEMLGAEELVDRIVTTHRGKIKLRGKSEPVSIFHIRDIQSPFRARMLEEIRRILKTSNTEAA